jgi:hypothetical protein
VEPGPADHLLERLTGRATADQRVEFGRRTRRLEQQRGLVVGEDAAGGSQPGDDGFG